MESLPPSLPPTIWKSIILYTIEEGNEYTEAYFFSFLKEFPEEKKTSAYVQVTKPYNDLCGLVTFYVLNYAKSVWNMLQIAARYETS